MVWSDYDAAIRMWRLTEHAGGVTRALPVEPRRSPFEVDSPSLSAGRVDWLFTNDGEPENFGAFARHESGPVQASQRTGAVAFAHDGGVAYYVEDGALKADDAVAYRRIPRSWQPMRPPR